MKIKYILLFLLIISCFIFASCSGDSSTESIQPEYDPNHVHAYKEVGVVAPKCNERGYTIKECTCGDVKRDNYVDALGHDAGEWREATVATCQQEGFLEKYCTRCGYIEESKVEPKLDHEYVEKEYPASCTEQGYTTHTCINCGYSFNDTFVAVKGHETGSAIVVEHATCTTPGKRQYLCVDCGKVLKEVPTEVRPHDYIEYSVPPTDNEEGYNLHICSMCGASYRTEYIPHTAVSEIKAKEVYGKSKDAVIQVSSFDKAGNIFKTATGFFISEDGKFVTSYDILEGAYDLSIIRESDISEIHNITILGIDKENNLAILKASSPTDYYLEVSNYSLSIGDTIFTISSPGGYADTFSSGIISHLDRYIDGKPHIQFNSTSIDVNNGAPLMDRDAKVIGIIVKSQSKYQGINLALNSSLITEIPMLEEPVGIQEYYNEHLEENAVAVFKSFIITHSENTPDEPVITATFYEPATATSYGRIYNFILDNENGKLYLQIEIIVDGMNRLKLTVDYDDIEGTFAFDVYDYNYAQVTIKGFLNHIDNLDIMSGSFNKTLFDKIIVEYETKYKDDPTTTNKNEVDIMNQLTYQSYSSLISKMIALFKTMCPDITVKMIGIGEVNS